MPNLNTILEMLDEENVAKYIHEPHAMAREKYNLRSIRVKEYTEFRKVIGEYYIHQFSATSPGQIAMSAWIAEGYAEKIVERAFGQIGGAKGACQMCMKGINGGMRLVIDQIFDRIIAEQIDAYYEAIFSKHINRLSWNDQVAVMQQFQTKFGIPGKQMKDPRELAAEYKENIKFVVEKLQILRAKIRR